MKVQVRFIERDQGGGNRPVQSQDTDEGEVRELTIGYGERWHFEGSVLTPLADGGSAVPVVKVDHDLEFRDGTRLVSGGTFTVHGADGSVWSACQSAWANQPRVAGWSQSAHGCPIGRSGTAPA